MPRRVSICLPVYNGERYLSAAIESALNSSFDDFEIIILDDCSCDRSAEIANNYANKDKRVRFVKNERRRGLFANYNACLTLAQGDFIKPFAQDDVLEKHALLHMVQVLEEYADITLVSGGKRWLDDTGREIKKLVRFPKNQVLDGKEVILAHLITLTNWVGEPSTVMFRRKQAGDGFDTHYFHYGDIEYWFRLLEQGKLFYLSEIVCGFRRHKESATSINLAGLYFALDILRLTETYQAYLSKLEEDGEHLGKRIAEHIALQIDHLVCEEGLDLEAAVKAQPFDREMYSAEDLSYFRKALYIAERRITSLMKELIATKNELEHRQAECQRLQVAVAQMDRSISWRLTAPLRSVRTLLKRSSE